MASKNTVHTWDTFNKVLITEFVPADHTGRVRDKLRRLVQISSAEDYLTDYRKIVLTIGDINNEEN